MQQSARLRRRTADYGRQGGERKAGRIGALPGTCPRSFDQGNAGCACPTACCSAIRKTGEGCRVRSLPCSRLLASRLLDQDARCHKRALEFAGFGLRRCAPGRGFARRPGDFNRRKFRLAAARGAAGTPVRRGREYSAAQRDAPFDLCTPDVAAEMERPATRPDAGAGAGQRSRAGPPRTRRLVPPPQRPRRTRRAKSFGGAAGVPG